MEAIELFDLTKWIDKEIVEKQVIQKYQELHTVLNSNAQPNQAQKPFEAQKNNLIGILESINIFQLSNTQMSILEKINIALHIGKNGIEYLEDLLYKNVIDIATSAKGVNAIIQKISAGIQKSNQLKTGLSGIIEFVDSEEDEIQLKIKFTENASILNISDLKQWSGIWYDIGRGIAMLHNLTPEDIKITGAQKGSIVIDMAVGYAVAKTIGNIILWGLKVAERVLELRKKVEELRSMKLSNDKAAKLLEEESKKEKEQGIERIVKNVTKESKIDSKSNGDKIVALTASIKNLVDFMEKGGEIDCSVPKQENEESEEFSNKDLKLLKESFEEIREIEDKLRLIEYRNP